ncbi:hypothetical protein CVV68_11855 [Arthrobacter livingstonensis]|uniref:Uncharacterized protein n=1 Tax=Arthrobacter livingstonensis TaxID=670078 RepID=A0A2V5L6F9_9MICC|nr:hypothetical protein CVV68_11855 [Arthrobacter livingstonensis]
MAKKPVPEPTTLILSTLLGPQSILY